MTLSSKKTNEVRQVLDAKTTPKQSPGILLRRQQGRILDVESGVGEQLESRICPQMDSHPNPEAAPQAQQVRMVQLEGRNLARKQGLAVIPKHVDDSGRRRPLIEIARVLLRTPLES